MQSVFENIIDKLEEQKVKGIYDSSSIIGEKNVWAEEIEIVKHEAEQYNNGWIPCSERLPEPIRPVLVTLRNWMNDKYFVRVGRFHTDHWKTDEGIIENSVVLAWQPLPAPYQPKGE